MQATIPRTNLPSRHPANKAINSWLVFLAAILVGLGSLYMAAIKHPPVSKPSTSQRSATQRNEAELSVAEHSVAQRSNSLEGRPPLDEIPRMVAPRAEPVQGPLTTSGTPMLSGSQYYVKMPDGRNILVNFRGIVSHPCNLPRQTGINNAAYSDSLGRLWVWTVPVFGPNIPCWIDP